SVLVIRTTGTGVTGTVAVHGSGVLPGVQTPCGASTAAVLITLAGGCAETCAVMFHVNELPPGNVATVSWIAPEPSVFGQTAPPLAEQVQVKSVRPAGRGSVMMAPSALMLPVLVTMTVKSTVPPGLSSGVAVVLTICRMGVEGSTVLAMQGGSVLFGTQSASEDGV